MADKEKTKQKGPWWQSRVVMLGLAVVAIGLIVAGSGFQRQKTADTDQEGAEATADPLYEYTERLENSVVRLCEGVKGVSDVRVAICLEGDLSYVYATDSELEQSGDRTQNHLQYVTVGSGASEKTVLLSRRLPRIEGIGVVCVGGGDGRIKQELISLLSTAFGVGSNKIYVVEANP